MLMREYLLKIVCGAVITTVLQMLPLRAAIRKILMFGCGCVMVLLTVTPLLHISPDSLRLSLPETVSSQLPELSEKNDAILQELICEQTEDAILQKAQTCGIDCTVSVTLRYDTAVGSYLPYSVRLNVTQSSGTVDELRSFLTQELAIPEERQTWVLN